MKRASGDTPRSDAHPEATHIEELDVHGTASVTALSACPGLAAGDGETVTGRFVTRRDGETVRITLIDGTALEGTPVHPPQREQRSIALTLLTKLLL